MDKIFRFDTYDKKHLKNLQERARIIDQLFNAVAERGVKLGLASGFKDSDKPFYFSDFPAIKKRMDTEIEKFSSNIKTVIEDGNTEEWLLSCRKNDDMVDMLHSSTGISKQRLEQLKQPNLSALEAFQSRKSAGMNLSDRVWRLGEQFKGELELALDVGLSEGRSAAQMSNDVRRYLREPDKLFRRVRDKHGVLRLSKSAQNYNPGRGVYRSSYKNAIRLTGTENNIAYRTADHLRWQQLDFVIGIEVKLSNNHTLNGRPFFDICDELAGVYPKGFKFTGWHPKCRCFAVPKLADMDEFMEREQRYVDGEDVSGVSYKGEVKDVPGNFKTWIEDNQERIERAKSKPYFIADNAKYVNSAMKIDVRKTPLEIAKERHANRTPEKEKEIRDAWKKRADLQAKKLAPKTTKMQVGKDMENKPSPMMPNALKTGGDYLIKEEYQFNKQFFDLIDTKNPIPLTVTKGKGRAGYNTVEKKIELFVDTRHKNSAWYRKSVVYHEFGHGIDWQRDLRKSTEISKMMKEQRKWLKEETTKNVTDRYYDYKKGEITTKRVLATKPNAQWINERGLSLSLKIDRMDKKTFTRLGITKDDVKEQILSTMDALMSLNSNYGWGHTKTYFGNIYMSEAEYIAHAFENAFIGNKVFEKFMPEIYREMVGYIKTLK